VDWSRILAYITGTVDQELLLRNEYLVAENRILRNQERGRLVLSGSEKRTLAEIGYRLGRKALEDVANAAKSDTILGWYRNLVAQKFDGSKLRQSPGRPRIEAEIERLIVCMAKENPSWGYDRIVGARWLISATRCQTNSGKRSAASWNTPCPGGEAHDDMGSVHSCALGGPRRNRLLQCGGLHPSWIGDLLCFVPHPHRKPQGIHRSDHRPSD